MAFMCPFELKQFYENQQYVTRVKHSFASKLTRRKRMLISGLTDTPAQVLHCFFSVFFFPKIPET